MKLIEPPAPQEVELTEAQATYDDGDLREAADILQKAEEIKKNEELMKMLKPYLKKKVESIDDIKKILAETDSLEAEDTFDAQDKVIEKQAKAVEDKKVEADKKQAIAESKPKGLERYKKMKSEKPA